MGAVTVVIRKRNFAGASKTVIADVTWSNSYANPGGDTYVNSQFELDTIDHIETAGAAAATNTGFMVVPDIANKKLRLYGGAASGVGLAQPTNASDQSATVARVIVHGNNPNI